MYQEKSPQLRVRYIPRLVPFITRSTPKAAMLMSKIDDGQHGPRTVKGYVYTLGFVQIDPINQPGGMPGSILDKRFFDNPDEMDLCDGAYDARSIIDAPDLTILCNKG